MLQWNIKSTGEFLFHREAFGALRIRAANMRARRQVATPGSLFPASELRLNAGRAALQEQRHCCINEDQATLFPK
jgi:hypothetical protein